MKKNVFICWYIGLLLSLLSGPLLAKIKLPAIFCDNLVLQQQSEVALWGKAGKNTSVRVITSWNNRQYQTSASADGSWRLKVLTPEAGGPYEITMSDGETVKLNNVLIGEVWVCSGQSNMGMRMRGNTGQPVAGSLEAITLSTYPNIRLFTVRRAKSLEPHDDFEGEWKLCEPVNVAEFSATAYFFGLELYKALHVPIGLINSSVGGTRIESWMSESGCRNFDWVKLPDMKPVENLSQQTPTVLFNGMINPMVGYGIRGVIWYQGEANRREPHEYLKLLPGLIKNWRTLWGIGDFPFYYMQIAPYGYPPFKYNSAYLREAQLKASTALPNTGMACILDIGEKDCIHPSGKQTGSKRLAWLAMAHTYRFKGITGQSPVFKEMSVKEGGSVELIFDHAPYGLTSFGKDLTNFEVAGDNRRFYPARAVITRKGVTLFSASVTEPIAVRYAFHDFVVGDLFGTNGLPVSSFRTDDWEPED